MPDLDIEHRRRRQRNWIREKRRQDPAYNKATPEQRRRYRLKREYDLTPEQYETMAAEGCRICGTHLALVVDHCHDTNKVRGILCHSCNVAIGHLRDDPDLLRAAITYLEG